MNFNALIHNYNKVILQVQKYYIHICGIYTVQLELCKTAILLTYNISSSL